MCGIVAASARRNIRDILINGLHTLEYRGYDSAGIALQQDGYLARQRAAGKVRDLEALLEATPIDSSLRYFTYPLGDPRRPEHCERASAHLR